MAFGSHDIFGQTVRIFFEIILCSVQTLGLLRSPIVFTLVWGIFEQQLSVSFDHLLSGRFDRKSEDLLRFASL